MRPAFTTNMSTEIRWHSEFERPDLQVKAFWSKTHDGFYVVTAYGFPTYIYVKHLDRWFGAANDMISVSMQHTIAPDGFADIECIAPDVLSDIYRRGIAGLVKHRILGKVKG